MAINVLLKRSTTASKRPTAAQLDIGELSLNYDADTAGVFFEDSAGNVRKVGPAEVSATAPNASPAGSSGNSLGELWYDTGASSLKIWTGSSFVAATAAGAAGGSDTQVQFNSTGTLAGSANFTFDGTTVSATGLSILGTSRFGITAIQDAIEILGRAGGTSSFRVALRPATLSANRTQDLQNLGGTVALNVNKLSFFAATTSAELAGVISDETGSGALVFATSPTLVTPVLGVATGTSFNGITGLSSTNPAALGAVAVGTGTTTARADHVHPTTGLGLTSGTLAQFAATTSSQLAGVISDETGSGALVFATSPSLTTPTLGVASATSINKVAITAPATSATLTIANGKTLTASNTLTFTGTDTSSVAFGTGGTVAYTANKLSVFAATTSVELAGVISDETGSGALVFAASPTLSGTPASSTAAVDTNTTQIATTAYVVGQASATNPLGLGTVAIGTSLRYARQDHVHPTTGLGLTSGTLAQFAATTSSQLAGVISDETGSGALVFATSPTLTTPTLGVATATSVNKVAITAPATSATLTIANGKTLTASNTLTFAGTDASSVAFGTGGTVAYTANKLSVFAATTSAELAGVISDETGSGSLVFGTSPSISTSLTTGSASFDLLPANATTVNFAGAATSLNLASLGGGISTITVPTAADFLSLNFAVAGGYQIRSRTRDGGKGYGIISINTKQDDVTGRNLTAFELVDIGTLARGNLFSVNNNGNLNLLSLARFGGTASRSTNPDTGLHIFNTTSTPTGTLTNGSSLYTVSGNLTAMDSVGNAVVLTPGVAGTVALTANKLSVFAATTSSELAGVISDETGSGALVFGTSPAITTSLTTPSTAFDLVNTTATTVNFAGDATTINIGASGIVAMSKFNHAIEVSPDSTNLQLPASFRGGNLTTGATSSAAGGVDYGTIRLTSYDSSTGNGNLNSGVSFSRSNSGRRRAMIACYQDSAVNENPCGLKFYTSAVSTAANDTVTHRFTISSQGEFEFVSAGTTASAANAFLSSGANNRLLRSTSSIRYKTDIEDVWTEKSNLVLQMRPVWYRSKIKGDNAGWSWYGLIAEEVAEIDPRLVHWGYIDEDYEWRAREAEDGTPLEPEKGPLKPDATLKPDGVQYERLSVLLINVIQEMNTRLGQVEQELAAVKGQSQ